MNKELIETKGEVVEEVVENCVIAENQGNHSFKKTLIGLGVFTAIAGVVTVVVRKNAEKIDAWRIKKLEKKGYSVLPPAHNEFDLDEEVVESEEN